MNKTAIALSLSLVTAPVLATNTPGADCVGVNACKTNSDNRTTNTVNQPTASVNGISSESRQGQSQGQQASATGGQGVGSVQLAPHTSLQTGGYVYNNRSLSITPVQPLAPAVVAPSASVSRVADPHCGPRQKVVSTDVNGVIIGVFRDRNVQLGQNQYLIPDTEEPYRHVKVMPGLTQLIGHKTHETTTVLTISASGAFAFGANGPSGQGGSIGGSRGGALQRMVTTIRLQECVAYEIKPEAPKVQPKPVKRAQAKKPAQKPQCDVCQRPSVTVNLNVSK